MVIFDPVVRASAAREHRLHVATDRPREAFEPNGLGNGGEAATATIVSAWLVGEGEAFDGALRKAVEWIEESERRDELFGDDPAHSAALRRRALAIALWLLNGSGERPVWQAAARASGPSASPEWPEGLAQHILDHILAGEHEAALEAAPAAEGQDIEVATALLLARANRDASLRPEMAAAVAALYRERAASWLDSGAFIYAAMWAKAVWFDLGPAATPEAALLAIYAFLPDAHLPPALVARGWVAPSSGPLSLRLSCALALETLDLAIRCLGLERDPDRARTPPNIVFASWTGSPGDDSEIDYRAEGGDARLEIRGERAAALANVLSAFDGGRDRPRPPPSLVDLLTPPRGPPQSLAGAVRWQTLRAALATACAANRDLLRALVAAGLRDPDWRTRMTAVLAVGRLRLADLAEQAMAAPAPEAGVSGLTQEERRSLLALRHAARNLALGLAPEADLAGEPGSAVMAKRRARQQAARILIDGGEAPGFGDDEAMVAALIGEAPASVPQRWHAWLDEVG
jgi:hypothetical protein